MSSASSSMPSEADTSSEGQHPGLSEMGVLNGAVRMYGALWQYSSGRRHLFVLALILLLASQLVRLGMPYLAGNAINTLQANGLEDLGIAGLWLAAVFGATLLSWSLHGPGRVLERNIGLLVRERVSNRLVQTLLRLPLSWHSQYHSGATAHRVQQSTGAIYSFSQNQFVYLQNAVKLVGPVAALCILDVWVGCLTALGLAVISLSITQFDRTMIRLAHVENETERRYASALMDALSNHLSVAALRQARGMADLVSRRLQAVFEPVRRSILVNEVKWGAVDILSQALSCGVLALYAWRVAHGGAWGLSESVPVLGGQSPAGPMPSLALGNLYMVWEYALQAGGVISAVAGQFQTFARQQADFASADVILSAGANLLSRDGEAQDDQLTDGEGASLSLRARNISLRHPNGTEALSSISLNLDFGKRYALIGGSGSGKSTLMRVAAGLLIPQEGQWLISRSGEADARDGLSAELDASIVGPAWLQRRVTLVPQDAEVVEGTLAENLALCESVHGPVLPDGYADALRAACVTDFIAADEAGLKTWVAERGGTWSGGQRQRVALARGILAAEGSALVLLDEPTASLDARTEQRVLRQIFERFSTSTVVASVHRLNLLSLFDEIILMDRGKVVAQGTVGQLEAKSPEFRALVERLDEAHTQADIVQAAS